MHISMTVYHILERYFMDEDRGSQIMSTLDRVAKSIVGEGYSITLLPDNTIGLDLFGINAIKGTTHGATRFSSRTCHT